MTAPRPTASRAASTTSIAPLVTRIARRLCTVALPLVAVALAAPALAQSKPFDTGSWNALLKAHAGRPLVVHFWGLTCAPCLVELPDWAKLERASPKAKFVYVQAETNAEDPKHAHHAPGKAAAKAGGAGAATLAKAGLGKSEQWSFAPGANEERLRFEVDPRWRGELPKTVLVAPDGTITPMRDGTDFARIRAWMAANKGAN